jgi:hypothetical protein
LPALSKTYAPRRCKASTKENYERRKNAERAKREKDISESWRAKLRDPVTLFTGILAIVAVFQLCALISTDRATHDLASAALKQAGAAERQSFAGRAYLFARYVINGDESATAPTFDPTVRTNPDTLKRKITFCINNAGQTPGMISQIEAHLYLPRANAEYVSERDDIETPRIAETRETSGSPIMAPGGGFFDSDASSGPVSVPGGADSCGFSRIFVFRGRPPGDFIGVHGALLYIKATYNDIFGVIERHTWYQVGLYGAGSGPGLTKYNHWD